MSCHDDTCLSITIGSVAGIENIDGPLHTFYSYPNPVHNEFRLHADSNNNLGLKIRDVTGRIVLDRIARNDEPIDAAPFSNGIYLMEVTDGSSTLTRKLIVQKSVIW